MKYSALDGLNWATFSRGCAWYYWALESISLPIYLIFILPMMKRAIQSSI